MRPFSARTYKSLSLFGFEFTGGPRRNFSRAAARLPDTSGELTRPAPVNVSRRHRRAAGPEPRLRCAEPVELASPGASASAQGSLSRRSVHQPPAIAGRRTGTCRAGSLFSSSSERPGEAPWPSA